MGEFNYLERRFREISIGKTFDEKRNLVKKLDRRVVLATRRGQHFPDCGELLYQEDCFGLEMNDGIHLFPYENLRELFVSD